MPGNYNDAFACGNKTLLRCLMAAIAVLVVVLGPLCGYSVPAHAAQQVIYQYYTGPSSDTTSDLAVAVRNTSNGNITLMLSEQGVSGTLVDGAEAYRLDVYNRQSVLNLAGQTLIIANDVAIVGEGRATFTVRNGTLVIQGDVYVTGAVLAQAKDGQLVMEGNVTMPGDNLEDSASEQQGKDGINTALLAVLALGAAGALVLLYAKRRRSA